MYALRDYRASHVLRGNTRRPLAWLIIAVWLLSCVGGLCAAEVIPPPPRDHFNDYAGIVAAPVARQLEEELTQFERDTSNQILVAIYPQMQTDSSIEDYTVRVAQSWKVGTQGKKNGAVLFIFSQDRKLFIQVGYGLEGVLPDARCKQIIANEITPAFRAGDYSSGVSAGVRAMLESVRGEYRGSGRTVKEDNRGSARDGSGIGGIVFMVFLFIVMGGIFGRRRNTVYGRQGRRSLWVTPPWGGGGFGGGGWSGGSGGGGGGGSFSGGGGSFGGGGAGGSW